MNITNKVIANIVFSVILIGSAGVSGLAAKQLVQSYPEVKSIFNSDAAKIKEVVAKSPDAQSGTATITNTNNRCIITVNGAKYDVTELRNTHSGGDIFRCNTDMTATFNSQHGNMYSLIQKYLVTASTSTNTNVSPNKGVTTSGKTVTLAQLKQHNTSSSCWIAYSGTVYDVTNNPSWAGCDHHGAVGGSDITSIFPHSTSYLSTLPVVGSLSGGSTSTKTSNSGSKVDDDGSEDEKDEDKLEQEKEDEKEWEFEFEN